MTGFQFLANNKEMPNTRNGPDLSHPCSPVINAAHSPLFNFPLLKHFTNSLIRNGEGYK
jgi:hypothetical protein